MTEAIASTVAPIFPLQIVQVGEAFALALDGYVLVDNLTEARAQSIHADYERRGASAILDSFEEPEIFKINTTFQ
jgi:hypothetical protein